MDEKKNNWRLCVLGGTGFIGRHLIKTLLGMISSKILVLSRNEQRFNFYSDRVEIVTGDLLDLNSLINFLIPNEVVVNLSFVRNGSEESNLRATDNLARACVEVGVRRLIHCSTAAVVGKVKDEVITEDTVCSPLTSYERTKLQIEDILAKKLKDKCEVVIVRPTAVFGEEGKNLLKLADGMVSQSYLMRKIKTSLYSKRRMNLVCVENVIEALIFLCRFEGDLSGECFIVSDDDADENNYYDVQRLLAEHLRVKQVSLFQVPFQPLVLRSLLGIFRRNNANPKRVYSSEKLARLGYQKVISFPDGIRRFASWYMKQK